MLPGKTWKNQRTSAFICVVFGLYDQSASSLEVICRFPGEANGVDFHDERHLGYNGGSCWATAGSGLAFSAMPSDRMCQTVMPRSSRLGMELNPSRPIMLLGMVRPLCSSVGDDHPGRRSGAKVLNKEVN